MKKFYLSLMAFAVAFTFWGCDPEETAVELTCTVAKTDVTVYGGNDGTITVTVVTGNEGYEYSLTSTTTTTNTTGSFTGLVAGDYSVSVKDSKNKTWQKDVTIGQAAPSELSVTLALDHVTCHSGNNGKITVTATGGILTYVYKLDDGNYQDGNTFESLTAGDYTVTVKSGDFIVTKNATITQPTALNATHSVVHPTSPGANGTITISATGGTTPYQYKLNDGEYLSSNIFNATSGTHTVTVTDANSCGPFVISGITLTDPVPPTVTTDTVTFVTSISAISGGNVLSGGGVPVTARGVVWSTSEEPTLESNSDYTSDGEGTGEFESLVTELTPQTTYYLRAYASNSFSTSYGETFSFTTSREDGQGDAVTDIEGNTYNTVWINNKLWMAENLKVTKYNDGNSIPNITSDGEWLNLSTGAYCWYENDEATYGNAYGALYNGYTVVTEKLCPTGWHIPTYQEVEELIGYIIAQGYPNEHQNQNNPNGAGNTLRSCRQIDSPLGGECNTNEHPRWDSSSVYGFDKFGFSALPNGSRYPYTYDTFNLIGIVFRIWTSRYSPEYTNGVMSIDLNASDIDTSYSESYNNWGFSVRCIKD